MPAAHLAPARLRRAPPAAADEARTHMSKAEWRAACARIETRLANLKESNLSLGLVSKGKR
jgi:hypothetical protein